MKGFTMSSCAGNKSNRGAPLAAISTQGLQGRAAHGVSSESGNMEYLVWQLCS